MHKTYLANIYSRIAITESMAIAKLGDDGYGIEASVFRESRGDDFKRVGIGLETICLHPLEAMRILGQQS